MALNLLIAPDFAPERFASLHVLNTFLQKHTGESISLHTPANAAEQAQLIAAGDIDFVYANPFDAAEMIRDKGYKALVRPIGKSDEMVIVAGADSAANTVEELTPGCKISLTDNKDVKLIGLRLLEPANLTEADIEFVVAENYQAAARMAIKGEVCAAFLLANAYQSFSGLTKKQLKLLVESHLADITHVVLASPKAGDQAATLKKVLLGMAGSADGQPVLEDLGMEQGFEEMSEEDAEFMIDLMDTLLS